MPTSIRFTVVSSSLGKVMLAATERGICALALDDSEVPLQQFLQEECPGAAIVRDDAGLADWSAKIIQQLEGRCDEVDVPLDAKGTAFQQRVWRELRKIPYGSTKTYTQIARAIGHPQSSRAVGRACATNPVSIVVPCHRVIRADGQLAGYRWGIERKNIILERERTRNQ